MSATPFCSPGLPKKSVSKNKLATAPNQRNAPLKIQNVAATWHIFVRMWRIFVTCGMQPLSWLNVKFLRRLKDTTIISVCAADQSFEYSRAANLYFKFTQTYNGLNDIHIFLFECYFIIFFLLQSRSSLKTSPVNEIVYSVQVSCTNE